MTDICHTNKQGFPNAIVAYCDLASPTAEDTLVRHKEVGNVVGIRQLIHYHPTKKAWQATPDDTLLTKPEWLEGMGLLGRHSLSFDLHVLSHQMGRASEVARMNPTVKFVVNHCGVPLEKDEASMRQWKEGLCQCTVVARYLNIMCNVRSTPPCLMWFAGMVQLASCPNVVAKVSGMFMVDRSWTEESVVQVACEVIQIFGIDR